MAHSSFCKQCADEADDGVVVRKDRSPDEWNDFLRDEELIARSKAKCPR